MPASAISMRARGQESLGEEVLDFYRTRFQIEFCYRDAKNFTELMDCKARDPWKRDFAFKCLIRFTQRLKAHDEGTKDGLFYVEFQVLDDGYVSNEKNLCGVT